MENRYFSYQYTGRSNNCFITSDYLQIIVITCIKFKIGKYTTKFTSQCQSLSKNQSKFCWVADKGGLLLYYNKLGKKLKAFHKIISISEIIKVGYKGQ